MILLSVLSVFVGSFLGVVADRLPARLSVVTPRSRCTTCQTTLLVRDLVPLVSFALLRGRCRTCGAEIPRMLPLIELASVAVMIWAIWVVPLTVLLPTVVLGWSLLVLSFIDGRHFMLPDLINWPLLIGGCAVAAWVPELDWWAHLMGALVGIVVFAIIRATFFAVRRVEGLGWGDVKLFGVAGAWLGVAGLPSTLLIAALSGLIYVLLRYRTLEAGRAIPFGVFLCIGIWFTWLYGPIAVVQ